MNRPPIKRSAKQIAVELGAAQEAAAGAALSKTQAEAAQLAQLANLLIAGYSLTSIGASIGATADEVDRMLNADMSRYVRNQPALRVFVRNYISSKYTDLLEAVWTEATDQHHSEKLEHQDRALRILKEMDKLHGSSAPTQTEVKIDAAPEAVDQIVARIAAAQGLGYDTNIFDVVPGTVVVTAAAQALEAVGLASDAVGDSAEADEEFIA